MKIAIPITNNKLSPHFGHCETFSIFTVADKQIVQETSVVPPLHEPGSHPRFLKEQGCSVIIAGGMGGRAQDLFHDSGIQTIIGAPDLPPEELVTCYLQGKLESGDNLCDH